MNKRPLTILLFVKFQYANVSLVARRIRLLVLAATIALPAVAETSDDSDFERCKASLKKAALRADVAEATVDKVLALATYDASIIELDGKQPEFTTTFADYLSKRVTQTRINRGRELGVTHAALLERLTRHYGVPGQYLLAFWGLETNFGGYMGKKQAPSALATLACDERRAPFFTRELIATMLLVEKNTLEPRAMESSWAGALGQTQFMPTTYLRYAVDGDGDGSVNLWSSIDDALASAAHYLSELGWQTGLRWGREIDLPSTFDWSAIGRKQVKSLAKWRSMGVSMATGAPLPAREDINAAIILPAGHTGPAFLLYKNFNVIMGWNRSEFYAISVGYLADRINGASELQTPAPKGQPRLSRDQVKRLQQALNGLGFDAGEADGIMGSGTRNAIQQYQRQNQMIADGFASAELVQHLYVARQGRDN